METQYSDLDIAVVAPDSDTLSVLFCRCCVRGSCVCVCACAYFLQAHPRLHYRLLTLCPAAY